MYHSDSELQTTLGHVRQGERHVAVQREIVSYFQMKGWPTEAAERLLLTFEDLLKMHRDHAHRIACKGWGVEAPPLIR